MMQGLDCSRTSRKVASIFRWHVAFTRDSRTSSDETSFALARPQAKRKGLRLTQGIGWTGTACAGATPNMSG